LDMQVFIKSVVPGGACDRDGYVQVGDTVLSVNGENVVGLSVAEIRERIVGPIGSEVAVSLESGATGQTYERVLVRGNAQPVKREEPQMMRSAAPESQYQLSRSMDARLFQSQVCVACA
jgi:C-terminal processing protease CtpA/Prc